jgi:hypothetical protein
VRNNSKGFGSVLVLVFVALAVGVVFLYKTQEKIGNWINFSTLNLEGLEILVDSNKNLWNEHQDSADADSIYLKYPVYLSRFRNISADLWPLDPARDDEKIAEYFRMSSDDGKIKGRSYRIVLKDAQPNTKNVGVKDWIIENKLNRYPDYEILREDLRKEFPIDQIVLDGRDAYEVKLIWDGDNLPYNDMIYFQTNDGIRAVGFISQSGSELLEKDYFVFKEILTTLKFVK